MATLSTGSTHAARDKILAIPELVQRIAHTLDSKTIVACARVNRAWHSIWLPIVWHTIDAGRQWRDPSFLNALHRHADLIRSLKCSRYDDIRLLFSSSPPSYPPNPYNSAEQPSSDPKSSHDGAVGPIGAKEQVLCKNLNTLALPKTTLRNQADQAQSHTLEKFLGRLNPTLQELSFKSTFFVKHPFGSGEDFAASASGEVTETKKESFGIQSLIMDGAACSQDFILCLCSRFPSLSHFSLGDAAEIESMEDDSIARLIRALPSLRTFRAAETRFGDESLEALIENCRDLSTLDINTTYVTKSSSVQRLLERSESLTTFDAWELSVNVPEMMSDSFGTRVSEREPTSEADVDHERAGAVSRSSTYSSARASVAGDRNGGIWACRALESLVLGVDYSADDLTEQERSLCQEDEDAEENEATGHSQGVQGEDENSGAANDDSKDDDEDDDEDDEDWIPGAEKSSFAKLQKKMAKLQVIDQDSNTLWIEYSLRSGLAILAPLKELRSISVTQGVHAIGVREVEWMSKNWPRLKSIEGLYEDEAEEAVAWLRKHRPDIELEDDD
ncbi:hypothetical protein BGX24_003021 [Mortierella sp. AD032]|nr:hypothetical protein BGX24_003021 [Mortierella sp. AD032]